MSSIYNISRFHIVAIGILTFAVFSVSLMVPLSSYGQFPASQDSPVDEKEAPLWTYQDASSPEWKPMGKGQSFKSEQRGEHYLWLMIPFPEGNWRNPIGVIHSAADTASRGMSRIADLLQNDEAQLQQSVKLVERNHQVITTASERIAETVQNLKTLATLDEALFQRVNIHENIDTTLSLLYHELRDNVIVIKEYGDIPRIQCYPNELNQAFMNLFRNAIQAIEQQGTITVATYADDTQVYIKISDTGEEIPPEARPRVFDPGFTTRGGGVGKGLGLSIVYNIIQKHHGDIEVDSEVGKGTAFTIALPIEQPRDN